MDLVFIRIHPIYGFHVIARIEPTNKSMKPMKDPLNKSINNIKNMKPMKDPLIKKRPITKRPIMDRMSRTMPVLWTALTSLNVPDLAEEYNLLNLIEK